MFQEEGCVWNIVSRGSTPGGWQLPDESDQDELSTDSFGDVSSDVPEGPQPCPHSAEALNYCRYCGRYGQQCEHYVACACDVCVNCECARPDRLPCWLPPPEANGGVDGNISDDSDDIDDSDGYNSEQNYPHFRDDERERERERERARERERERGREGESERGRE